MALRLCTDAAVRRTQSRAAARRRWPVSPRFNIPPTHLILPFCLIIVFAGELHKSRPAEPEAVKDYPSRHGEQSHGCNLQELNWKDLWLCWRLGGIQGSLDGFQDSARGWGLEGLGLPGLGWGLEVCRAGA